MSTVQEIEAAIRKLPPKEIEAVADWLAELREEMWDRQIAADAQSGKLNSLIQEAKTEYRASKATPFP
jgi:hypothetical protein